MSGPSVLHEDRVSMLRDLADLSGYVLDTQLALNPRPDVVRLHRSAPAVLIGDAKATETPGNAETRSRLLSYLTAAGPWLAAGFDVRIAICHGSDPKQSWAKSVARLAALLKMSTARVDVRAIDLDTWISSITVGPAE